MTEKELQSYANRLTFNNTFIPLLGFGLSFAILGGFSEFFIQGNPANYLLAASYLGKPLTTVIQNHFGNIFATTAFVWVVLAFLYGLVSYNKHLCEFIDLKRWEFKLLCVLLAFVGPSLGGIFYTILEISTMLSPPDSCGLRSEICPGDWLDVLALNIPLIALIIFKCKYYLRKNFFL